jgi:hypothetical protein
MHVWSYGEDAAMPDALIHTFYMAASATGRRRDALVCHAPLRPQIYPNMAMRRRLRLFRQSGLRNCDNGHLDGAPMSSGGRAGCVQKLLQESPCHLHVIVWSPRTTRTTTHRCHEPSSPMHRIPNDPPMRLHLHRARKDRRRASRRGQPGVFAR